MKSFVFLATLWATFRAPFVVCDVSEEAQQLALKWAPLVWLHPEEKFFPASPEFIINNMEVNSDKTYSIEAFRTVARLASRRSFLLNLIIITSLLLLGQSASIFMHTCALPHTPTDGVARILFLTPVP